MPWFIVGSLVMAAVRSLGVFPAAVLPGLASTASLLTAVSMAALGLGVDVRVVAKAGGGVTLTVVGSLAVLAAISLALLGALRLR